MPLRVSNGGGGAGLPKVTLSGSMSIPGDTVNWSAIAYGNGRYIAVSYGSNEGATSTDGITWTALTLPVSANWTGIAYGDGRFVIIANNLNNPYYSINNGITWIATNQVSTSAGWTDIVYGNNAFVAVQAAGSSYFILYSPAGTHNWALRNMANNSRWVNVIYGNVHIISAIYANRFIAIASDSATVNYSADGETWYSGTSGALVGTSWSSIAYANGVFVAIPTSGTAYRTSSSLLGSTWTARTLPISATWSKIYAFNDRFFLLITGVEAILTSTDGINWDIISLGGTGTTDRESMIYANGKYILLNKGYRYSYWSLDGMTWSGSPTTQELLVERNDSDTDKDYEFYGDRVTIQSYTDVRDINTGESYIAKLQSITGEVL